MKVMITLDEAVFAAVFATIVEQYAMLEVRCQGLEGAPNVPKSVLEFNNREKSLIANALDQFKRSLHNSEEQRIIHPPLN
jgi:hypothetical protein